MDTTSFGKSIIGLVLVGVIFFIKDVLILIIEILINIISLFGLREYIKKKKSIGALLNMENQSLNTNNETNEMTIPPIRSESIRVRHTKINKNLTYMVLVICSFSAIGHVLTIACAAAFMVSQDIASYGICFSSSLFISFKNFFNILIFLLFNSLFLNEFRLFMGL